MRSRIILLIAIVAALLQPLVAQTQQVEEKLWSKYSEDFGMVDIVNAVFTPDNQSILVTDANKKLVEIDAVTGALKREIPNIKGVFKFSDDGQFVYTYDFKKVNYATGEEIGQFKTGEFPVSGFTDFDLNEKAGYLIGVQYDWSYPYLYWAKSIYVYSLNTFKFVDTLGLDRHYYRRIKITEDGKYFRTGSRYDPDPDDTSDNDDVNMLWNAKTLDTIRECPDMGNIKTSPDGKWLGSVGHPSVRVLYNDTWEIKYDWDPDNGVCLSNALDFTSDSKYLVTKGPNCYTDEENLAKIRVWDLEKGEMVYKYSIPLSTNKIVLTKTNKVLSFSGGGLVLFNWMVETSVEDKEIIGLLYPNPSSGELILNNEKLISGNLYIDLSNTAGNIIKVLYNGHYDGSGLSFNISDIAAGTYILKAVQNNNTFVYKVIKEN